MWQPRKGHVKCIFETLHNEINCVLSVKESNFNEKNNQNFHICLRSGPRWLTPPLSVSLTVKYRFFWRLALVFIKKIIIWSILQPFYILLFRNGWYVIFGLGFMLSQNVSIKRRRFLGLLGPRARRACVLIALGLLLADSAPTVGKGKTFWRVDRVFFFLRKRP